jgi:hypothetical protein
MEDITKEELAAFFRSCERNGISVSRTPREERRNPVIIGENRALYTLDRDMKIVPVGHKRKAAINLLSREGTLKPHKIHPSMRADKK